MMNEFMFENQATPQVQSYFAMLQLVIQISGHQVAVKFYLTQNRLIKELKLAPALSLCQTNELNL